MEKQIKQIIDKVRTMFKYDTGLTRGLVTVDASVHLKECNGTLHLSTIDFESYDRLSVSATEIVFYPEMGNQRTVMTYDGWDELLRM